MKVLRVQQLKCWEWSIIAVVCCTIQMDSPANTIMQTSAEESTSYTFPGGVGVCFNLHPKNVKVTVPSKSRL